MPTFMTRVKLVKKQIRVIISNIVTKFDIIWFKGLIKKIRAKIISIWDLCLIEFVIKKCYTLALLMFKKHRKKGINRICLQNLIRSVK